MANEEIEPERADPSAWIPWIGAVVSLLALALIFSMVAMGGDREVGLAWILVGVGSLLAATLLLPAWAIFGTRS